MIMTYGNYNRIIRRICKEKQFGIILFLFSQTLCVCSYRWSWLLRFGGVIPYGKQLMWIGCVKCEFKNENNILSVKKQISNSKGIHSIVVEMFAQWCLDVPYVFLFIISCFIGIWRIPDLLNTFQVSWETIHLTDEAI